MSIQYWADFVSYSCKHKDAQELDSHASLQYSLLGGKLVTHSPWSPHSTIEEDDGAGETFNKISHISVDEQLAEMARFGGFVIQKDPFSVGSILFANTFTKVNFPLKNFP